MYILQLRLRALTLRRLVIKTLGQYIHVMVLKHSFAITILIYDGPNAPLFISILLHNSEFRILNFEFRIPKFSKFEIVKYRQYGQVVTVNLL